MSQTSVGEQCIDSVNPPAEEKDDIFAKVIDIAVCARDARRMYVEATRRSDQLVELNRLARIESESIRAIAISLTNTACATACLALELCHYSNYNEAYEMGRGKYEDKLNLEDFLSVITLGAEGKHSLGSTENNERAKDEVDNNTTALNTLDVTTSNAKSEFDNATSYKEVQPFIRLNNSPTHNDYLWTDDDDTHLPSSKNYTEFPTTYIKTQFQSSGRDDTSILRAASNQSYGAISKNDYYRMQHSQVNSSFFIQGRDRDDVDVEGSMLSGWDKVDWDKSNVLQSDRREAVASCSNCAVCSVSQDDVCLKRCPDESFLVELFSRPEDKTSPKVCLHKNSISFPCIPTNSPSSSTASLQSSAAESNIRLQGVSLSQYNDQRRYNINIAEHDESPQDSRYKVTRGTSREKYKDRPDTYFDSGSDDADEQRDRKYTDLRTARFVTGSEMLEERRKAGSLGSYSPSRGVPSLHESLSSDSEVDDVTRKPHHAALQKVRTIEMLKSDGIDPEYVLKKQLLNQERHGGCRSLSPLLRSVEKDNYTVTA